MGRLLDLILPGRAYRREREERERKEKERAEAEQLARIERMLEGVGRVLERLDKVTCTGIAGLSKKSRTVCDGLDGIEKQLERIEGHLESVELLMSVRNAEEANSEKKVTPRQILQEYLYGEGGDE